MIKAATLEASPHAELRLDLRARARSLAPKFRARALDAENQKRLPDASIRELHEAGLFKMIQPCRVDGIESTLHELIDTVAEVASGCGSTGWVLGVVNAHHWMVGLFPARAQDDVFAARPDALVAASFGARGKVTRVPDGYRITGFWPFCSGSPAADWVMLGGQLLDDQGQRIDAGDFLIPINEVVIKDDWDVTGLRGSGSNSVVAQDVFVPEHRFLSMAGAIRGESPGRRQHGQSRLYESAIIPVLSLCLVPAALGVAQGALELFLQRLPGKIVSYTLDELQQDMPVTHIQLGLASSKIHAARLVMHNVAEKIERAAALGEAMSLEERASCRMECAYSVRLCFEATEILYLASGGSGLAVGNPIQRASRDLHAMNLHGLLCLETNLEMFGRVLLGLPQNTRLI